MAGLTRTQLAEIRGAIQMAVDASSGVVDVVERMHRTVQRLPLAFGQPVEEPTRGITGFVYRNVRGGMRLCGRGIAGTLAPLEQLLPAGETTPGRELFASMLNGVYGDHLAQTGNPLAIAMTLRHAGRIIDPAAPRAAFAGDEAPIATGHLLLLVHGLCMSDQQWDHEGFSHGAALAAEFGLAPLALRYNSGLPIAENGRQLAGLLETLVRNWPRPIESLTLVGHSMGGLVARSACLEAEGAGHGWRRRLRRMVFLGTPHHGAPLERGGHGLDYLLALSPYSAPFVRLGAKRSAGIRDLRHGTITPGEHRVVPLPEGVACYAVAATLGASRNVLGDRLVGDGLVPLDSALGRHANRRQSLAFARERRWIGTGMGHLELLHRPEVYAQLRAWLADDAGG
jgi:pimeloyl-ACP methyl ester carboxylesterase